MFRYNWFGTPSPEDNDEPPLKRQKMIEKDTYILIAPPPATPAKKLKTKDKK